MKYLNKFYTSQERAMAGTILDEKYKEIALSWMTKNNKTIGYLRSENHWAPLKDIIKYF